MFHNLKRKRKEKQGIHKLQGNMLPSTTFYSFLKHMWTVNLSHSSPMIRAVFPIFQNLVIIYVTLFVVTIKSRQDMFPMYQKYVHWRVYLLLKSPVLNSHIGFQVATHAHIVISKRLLIMNFQKINYISKYLNLLLMIHFLLFWACQIL